MSRLLIGTLLTLVVVGSMVAQWVLAYWMGRSVPRRPWRLLLWWWFIATLCGLGSFTLLRFVDESETGRLALWMWATFVISGIAAEVGNRRSQVS
jgi:predicted membrane protein